MVFGWCDCSYTQAPVTVPTQQCQDTGEDRDQGSCTEAGWQDIGLRIAGLGDPIGITVADADGESVGAAEGRRATVHDEDGQIVNRLFLSSEAISPGENGSCVVQEKANT